MPKINGFTLAEVLISLTIIGLVAAMTMPTLISKYQKHTFYVGLVEAQNIMTNAIQGAPAEAGCGGGDYECAGLISNIDNMYSMRHSKRGKNLLLIERLKVVKTIPSSECYGADYFTVKNGKKTKANTNSADATLNCGKSYITENGMLWGKFSHSVITGQNGWLVSFFVDVNGNKKGPNTLGRDVFVFDIMLDSEFNGIKQGTLIPYGSKQFATSRSMWGNFYWKDQSNSCSSTNLNAYCTGRVLEEKGMNY